MTKEGLENHKGSITVEAAMIIPIVIIAVMIVLYITLIIFQICAMQLIANNVSERAAAVCTNSYSDFETGKVAKSDLEKLRLYRRLGLSDSFDEDKLKAVSINMLHKAGILTIKDASIDIKHQNTILSQRVIVEISASYSNPLGGLSGIWGLGRRLQLRVKSQAVVDDPAEFIRNSDFILETASSIPILSEFEGKWNEIITKIVEYVDSLNKERKQIDN